MLELIKKGKPTLEVLEKSIIDNTSTDVRYFEIVTPAIDKDIYNFMYFFTIENELAIGMFNCYDDEKDNWQPIIRQVVKSLEIIGNGGEK